MTKDFLHTDPVTTPQAGHKLLGVDGNGNPALYDAQGTVGPQGPQGAQGPAGVAGPQGPAGNDASLTAASVGSLPSATSVNSMDSLALKQGTDLVEVTLQQVLEISSLPAGGLSDAQAWSLAPSAATITEASTSRLAVVGGAVTALAANAPYVEDHPWIERLAGVTSLRCDPAIANLVTDVWPTNYTRTNLDAPTDTTIGAMPAKQFLISSGQTSGSLSRSISSATHGLQPGDALFAAVIIKKPVSNVADRFVLSIDFSAAPQLVAQFLWHCMATTGVAVNGNCKPVVHVDCWVERIADDTVLFKVGIVFTAPVTTWTPVGKSFTAGITIGGTGGLPAAAGQGCIVGPITWTKIPAAALCGRKCPSSYFQGASLPASQASSADLSVGHRYVLTEAQRECLRQTESGSLIIPAVLKHSYYETPASSLQGILSCGATPDSILYLEKGAAGGARFKSKDSAGNVAEVECDFLEHDHLDCAVVMLGGRFKLMVLRHGAYVAEGAWVPFAGFAAGSLRPFMDSLAGGKIAGTIKWVPYALTAKSLRSVAVGPSLDGWRVVLDYNGITNTALLDVGLMYPPNYFYKHPPFKNDIGGQSGEHFVIDSAAKLIRLITATNSLPGYTPVAPFNASPWIGGDGAVYYESNYQSIERIANYNLPRFEYHLAALTVAVGDVFTLTINGSPYTFTATTTAIDDVGTGLDTAVGSAFSFGYDSTVKALFLTYEMMGSTTTSLVVTRGGAPTATQPTVLHFTRETGNTRRSGWQPTRQRFQVSHVGGSPSIYSYHFTGNGVGPCVHMNSSQTQFPGFPNLYDSATTINPGGKSFSAYYLVDAQGNLTATDGTNGVFTVPMADGTVYDVEYEVWLDGPGKVSTSSLWCLATLHRTDGYPDQRRLYQLTYADAVAQGRNDLQEYIGKGCTWEYGGHYKHMIGYGKTMRSNRFTND